MTSEQITGLPVLMRALAEQDKPQDRAALRLHLARELRRTGDFDAARLELEVAAREDPASALIRYTLGQELVRAGDPRRGLVLLEKGRWAISSIAATRRPFDQPYWDGSPGEGRKLLVWAEQGIGDQIMQLRFLSAIVDAGWSVSLEASARLFEFLGPLRDLVECVPATDPPARTLADRSFDAQTSLFHAWRYFPERPVPQTYLFADVQLTGQYRSIFAGMGPEKNIGLSWKSANPKYGASRSLDVSDFLHLSGKEGVRFHSVQYGDHDFAGLSGRFGGPLYNDPTIDARASLTRQAAQIKALDLVITIDNSVAHLAAALGVPTWVLLPRNSHWTWGNQEETTPLYPGVRVFRQRDTQDWASTLYRLSGALDLFLAGD